MNYESGFLPAVFFKFKQQVLHFVAIPVFFFLFMFLYKPFDTQDLLSLRYAGFSANCALISAIIFFVVLLTRILLWGIRNVGSFKRGNYVLWCVGEIVVCSLFVSLYITLMSGGHYAYIDVLPRSIAIISAILVYPYSIITLVLESDIIARYTDPLLDASRLRFYDERHNLKFVTQPRAVLYIRSDENYCDIVYSEDMKIKKFTIRSTMKSLEDSCSKHGIVRCHRSYFVNVARIKVLRREREGLNIAQMDFPGCDNIPVTPRYYDRIAGML